MVRQHPATNKGFTLIEIVVVSAMTGVLVGMSVPRMSAWRARLDARATARAMGDMLHAATGRSGLLELMLSEDKHGYTPLDYVVPEQGVNKQVRTAHFALQMQQPGKPKSKLWATREE